MLTAPQKLDTDPTFGVFFMKKHNEDLNEPSLVYVSTAGDGTIQYVGITDNLEARAAAHSTQKGIEIDPIPELQKIRMPNTDIPLPHVI